MFEKDELEPTWWEEKLWQLYDAPAYAENFRNVPLVAYSGEKDRQKQAADLMAERAGEGRHPAGARHRPGHRAQLPPRRQGRASTGWSTPWPRAGRDPLPRRVTPGDPDAEVQPPGLGAGRRAWASTGPGRASTAELRGDGRRCSCAPATSPRSACCMPSGPGAVFPRAAPSPVIIDGQRLAGPPPASDRSWTARFHKAGRPLAGRGRCPTDGPAQAPRPAGPDRRRLHGQLPGRHPLGQGAVARGGRAG